MKFFSVLAFLSVFPLVGYSSIQPIVCGDQPGEIYFVSFVDGSPFTKGLYYSSDYGEHITLIDTTEYGAYGFGYLLRDAGNSSIYSISLYDGGRQDFSSNGGMSWVTVNEDAITEAYASGVISGECYRRKEYPQLYKMERSINCGEDYILCSTIGIPNTFSIQSAALGVDSGEVFILSLLGHLFYSSDYAESTTYISDLFSLWGISHNSSLVNGVAPGEFYIYYRESHKIWHAYDYGNIVEEIADFPPSYTYWGGGLASGNLQGELYFYAFYPSGPFLGPQLHIYYTSDYGNNWILYEHILGSSFTNYCAEHVPSFISLSLYPNPANPSFTIDYTLDKTQTIQFGIYNMLGQKVWTYSPGEQAAGNYQLNYSGEKMSSGTYLLKMQSENKNISKIINILK